MNPCNPPYFMCVLLEWPGLILLYSHMEGQEIMRPSHSLSHWCERLKGCENPSRGERDPQQEGMIATSVCTLEILWGGFLFFYLIKDRWIDAYRLPVYIKSSFDSATQAAPPGHVYGSMHLTPYPGHTLIRGDNT